MNFNHTLQSDFTIELAANQEQFILISGILSKLLVSIDGTVGYNIAFKLSNDSSEYFIMKKLTTDLQWENIPISGTPTASITTKQDSISLEARKIVWIKNIGTEIAKISIRGNR